MDEFLRALKLPEVRESPSLRGLEPAVSTQPQFAAFVRTELQKYANLIKQTGARIE